MRCSALVACALFGVRPAMGEKKLWNGGSLVQAKQEEHDPVSIEKKSGNEKYVSEWTKGGGHDEHKVSAPANPEWAQRSNHHPASGRTSSGAEKNKRGLRVLEERQDSPQQGTSRNLHHFRRKWDCMQCCFLKKRCVAGFACIKPRLWGWGTCQACGGAGAPCCATRYEEQGICENDSLTCNATGYCEKISTCTTLESDDRSGLQRAIEAMVDAGDTKLSLCPTTVTWNSGYDPLGDDIVPSNFTLECDAGADESEDCVLDGGRESSFFATRRGGVSWAFRGITFRNGKATGGSGGAIAFTGQGSHLTIDACHFEDNQAVEDGGAIVLYEHANLEVKDSEFLRNEALAGAVALYQSSADFTAGGNVFRDNIGHNGGGGLAVWFNSHADLCSKGSDGNTFEGNGMDYSMDIGSSILLPNTNNYNACEITQDTTCGNIPS